MGEKAERQEDRPEKHHREEATSFVHRTPVARVTGVRPQPGDEDMQAETDHDVEKEEIQSFHDVCLLADGVGTVICSEPDYCGEPTACGHLTSAEQRSIAQKLTPVKRYYRVFS